MVVVIRLKNLDITNRKQIANAYRRTSKNNDILYSYIGTKCLYKIVYIKLF